MEASGRPGCVHLSGATHAQLPAHVREALAFERHRAPKGGATTGKGGALLGTLFHGFLLRVDDDESVAKDSGDVMAILEEHDEEVEGDAVAVRIEGGS